MGCPNCGSEAQKLFDSEIAIHFPGMENLAKPHVIVCPKLLVCMNCGRTELQLQEKELSQLSDGCNSQRTSFSKSAD